MHTLPDLNFDLSALEPHIDARTMEIHHGKHHAGYVAKLNKALESASPEVQAMTIEELLQNYTDLPEEIHSAVRNNGGGHANHTLFWSILNPNGGGEPVGQLSQAINDAFGSFTSFQEMFATSAASQFGSGWAWLTVNASGELAVYGTPNQDSPLMRGDMPILGIDVWEHAYYLNYQNRRPDYISAFWNVVDWDMVATKFAVAQ